MTSNIKAKLLLLTSLLFCYPVFAANFSNTSLDGKLGADSVKGTFIDSEGGTGGAVEEASTGVIKMVIAVCALLGFILAAKGIYDLYGASRNGQTTYTRAFVTLIIGCALAILPAIVFYTAHSVEVFG